VVLESRVSILAHGETGNLGNQSRGHSTETNKGDKLQSNGCQPGEEKVGACIVRKGQISKEGEHEGEKEVGGYSIMKAERRIRSKARRARNHGIDRRLHKRGTI